jgi:hypothetical protein
VGEADLEPALASLPAERRNALILLQNELFPSQWRRFAANPTVMIPWLLKKKGEPPLVGRSTPVYGPCAPLVCELHAAIGQQAEELASFSALQQAIVDKYAFILCVNALGSLRDLTLEAWIAADPARVDALTREAAALGALLVEAGSSPGAAPEAGGARGATSDVSPTRGPAQLDPARTLREVRSAMANMGAMRARGRSARTRLDRALAHARRLGLTLPGLAEAARAAHAPP